MADMATVAARAPFALTDEPSRTELLAKYFRGLGDPTRRERRPRRLLRDD
jgi:hypothetical protein